MYKKSKMSKAMGIALSATLLLSPTLSSQAQMSASSPKSTDEQKQLDNQNAIQEAKMTSIASGETRTITLLTGDVITVTGIGDGKITIDIEPVDGGEDRTRIMTINNETFVIPEKAMPYVASEQLDQDLFNITKLLEYGYDDSKVSSVPIIVQYTAGKARALGAVPTPPAGSQQTRVLESIQGAALSTDKTKAGEFWKALTKNLDVRSVKAKAAPLQLEAGIQKVWLDGKVEANLDKSVPQVGAPTAWEVGYDGKGTTVAVLDTGIDQDHPDIAPQLDDAVNFVPGEDINDYNSHGTHVASTVLGTGAASEGRNKGVAPGARLVVGKVLANNGTGQDSWVIDGMEWAADKAKIVNMSLGSSEASDGTDPMSQAVNRLSAEKGTLFVIAAGNKGGDSMIGAPGAADAALTVGAISKTDQLASFSSRGPRLNDYAIKPDLSAPGVGIVAARSQYSSGSGVYMSKNGTSMATPHVAGAAAIVAQKHPDWTGEQIKQALMSSTKQLQNLKPYQIGAGRLDIPAALGDIQATGSVSFGFFDWPHAENEVIERTVTYTNDSDTDVTLDLVPVFANDKNQPAPEGMLKVSADKITVPAKGSVSIKISVDAGKGALGTKYQGQLFANVNGKTVAHTAMAMVKEDERYNLKLQAFDRDGSPNLAYALVYSPGWGERLVEVNGSTELRVPVGTYSITSLMEVDTKTDNKGVAFVGDPEFEVKKDSTLDLDARQAREVKAEAPKKNEPSFKRMEYFIKTSKGRTGQLWQLPSTVDKIYTVPVQKMDDGNFELAVRWRLIKPTLTIKLQGKELDDLPQIGVTNLDGEYRLPVVYVGKGGATDYAGLDAKGKIAVVERSDEVSTQQRAAAAIAAGVKLLLVVNDKPQELRESYVDANRKSVPLAIAAVSGTEGASLVEAARSGKLMLDVEAVRNTPYLYDLVKAYNDVIPAGKEALLYAPTEDELAKVDSRYYSDRLASGEEWRFDFRPHRSLDRKLDLDDIDLPMKREEWVSVTPGSTWYQKAMITDDFWEVRDKLTTYNPGGRSENHWFAPVVRPAFSESFYAPYREGNNVHLNVPAWSDGGMHAGFLDPSTLDDTVKKLYQGDTLIHESKGQGLVSPLGYPFPSERTQYRLVSDSKRDPARWHTSVQTHTEWKFWSDFENKRVTLPLLALHYDIKTSLSGDSLAGATMKLGLSATHIAGAKGAGNIEGATLEVSFDEGKTWSTEQLKRKDGKWVAYIKHPKKHGGSVSLRASAWDDAGNSIKQEIIKAYGLR
ncbi:S8 family serine peptidase [Ectobacillus sp. JY-23]|uniref:S8 family peptidase n=1 Tax=Ectobacillus sp. JY-23 TaxID=2933872 RepID=UPI001FF4A327|nr:S8 family serine peptidase [Ectobacillus sp. JY-23]UOY91756.1 S8 family serine peptidase [Ectobacillus sp. JY-23]